MTEQDLAVIEARLKAHESGRSLLELTQSREDIADLLAEVKRLRSALEGLVDDERCQYDHHGYCQTHGIAKPCEMAVAREALSLPSLS